MPPQSATIADQLRSSLRDGGSPRHSDEVQWFFKEEVKSHGWYTQPLRQAAYQARKAILQDYSLEFLLEVADELFQGDVLEEKVFAVFLLEKSVASFGDREFRRFEGWLNRISSWADHDGLLQYLIGPLVAADARRVKRPLRWAKSRDRWHRRAAAVALIRGSRKKLYFEEITLLCDLLLDDQDDMVQKGLGWLLRETAKADPERALPLLMEIRARAPRLVLRTACETLPPAVRKRILALGGRRS